MPALICHSMPSRSPNLPISQFTIDRFPIIDRRPQATVRCSMRKPVLLRSRQRCSPCSRLFPNIVVLTHGRTTAYKGAQTVCLTLEHKFCIMIVSAYSPIPGILAFALTCSRAYLCTCPRSSVLAPDKHGCTIRPSIRTSPFLRPGYP